MDLRFTCSTRFPCFVFSLSLTPIFYLFLFPSQSKMLNMVSATATSFTMANSSKGDTFSPKHIFPFKRGMNKNEGKHFLRCVSSSFPSNINSISKINVQSASFSASRLTGTGIAFEGAVVADKLHRLVSEFQYLSEPIDRVKRLLHYAALLPPLEELDRVPENRVMGCATQVWLKTEMDKCGRMRFEADSDSEISKGFCSCLIWMLDGAEPEEVLMVETEDLADINVGFPIKAQSRVNTWHNVLFSMQKATKALVVGIDRKPPPQRFFLL